MSSSRLSACVLSNLRKINCMVMLTMSEEFGCIDIKANALALVGFGGNSDLLIFIFSCDQATLWMVQSVRPSVRLSVRLSVCPSVTPFLLCSHHCIIMKFSGVITSDKSDVHAKGQGQRSKVKVTKVTTQLNRFRTVTPSWIHIWWWNDAYSLIMLRRGALLFFKVIRQN